MSIGGLAAPVLGALADATSLRAALVPPIVPAALGRLLLCGLREPAAAVESAAVRWPPRGRFRETSA